MPTYVYRCAKGHEWDLWYRSIPKDIPETPPCDICKLEGYRVITPVEWRTKGKGWYQNNYKSSDAYVKGDKSQFKKRMWKE